VNAAGAILDSPRLTGAQARHAAQLLQSAAFLNPDRQVDVLRAQLRRDQGDLRGARAILRPVISSEPDNLQAWLELARSSAGDPHDFFLAAFRVRQLVRTVPPPR
jgi:predicted Zn-dependent protease